ncbi:MAG TPA: hypothetical protein EYN67_04970 [Flavobacteriales bacterium]|nr:hypothetical protein [Flavobacteriales bacterium]
MNELKEGDVFKWAYNEKTINGKFSGRDYTSIYWCQSQIGIVKDGRLVDTYWSMGNDRSFSLEDIRNDLDVIYQANMSELVEAKPEERAYYPDTCCFDFNHPNSTRGNFYLVKGARKSVSKMKRVMQRQKHDLESSIRSTLMDIEQLENDILNINEESWILNVADVSLEDHSYSDEIIKLEKEQGK